MFETVVKLTHDHSEYKCGAKATVSCCIASAESVNDEDRSHSDSGKHNRAVATES